MSKIAKALEKSQLGREDTFLAGGPADITSQDHAEELKELVYTHSKVLNLNTRHLEQHRIAAYLSDPRVMDYYNILRTQILQRTRDKNWNTIMVTSPAAGDGKTLTAINLALSIARKVQHTALLVDTNLRGPKVCEYLGLRAPKGLSDYLTGEASIDDLFINPGIAKLLILPAGELKAGTSELLGSPQMHNLIRELKNRYPDRYVIFDCPHMVHMPDSQIFSEFVDCILMVVRANKTRTADISEAMRLIHGRGFLGSVMNEYA